MIAVSKYRSINPVLPIKVVFMKDINVAIFEHTISANMLAMLVLIDKIRNKYTFTYNYSDMITVYS